MSLMTQAPPKARGRVARTVRMATTRPRLFVGVVIGVVAWLALDFAPGLRWSTRAILAWDAGVFTALTGMLIHMVDKRADDIRASSAEQDEGQGMILTIVLIACIASLATIAAAHAASLLRSARSGALSFSLVAAGSSVEEREDAHALAD